MSGSDSHTATRRARLADIASAGFLGALLIATVALLFDTPGTSMPPHINPAPAMAYESIARHPGQSLDNPSPGQWHCPAATGHTASSASRHRPARHVNHSFCDALSATQHAQPGPSAHLLAPTAQAAHWLPPYRHNFALKRLPTQLS